MLFSRKRFFFTSWRLNLLKMDINIRDEDNYGINDPLTSLFGPYPK